MLLVIALGVVLLAALITFLAIRLEARDWNGLSAFARRRILRGGVGGQATVLDVTHVKTSMNNHILWHVSDLVLEVRAAGAPYRVPCRMVWTSGESYDARPGKVLPVRIDPSDPQRVLIDVRAEQRADAQRRGEDVAAHQARQAALLAGAPVADAGPGPLDGLPPDAMTRVQDAMRLCATGAAATGTIVAVEERGANAMFCVLAVSLTVQPLGGDAWPATAIGLYKAQRRGELVPGTAVPVKYDAADRSHVAIDVRHV